MHQKVFLFVAALGLLAVKFAVAGASAHPLKDGPEVCALVKPVGSQTFSDDSAANKDNAPILHKGACVGDGQKRCSRNAIHPVCGINLQTQRRKTYDNICWAEKDWAQVLYQGRCH